MLTIAILKSRLAQLAVIGLLGSGVGAFVYGRMVPPTTTTTIVHDIQQVRVDVPVLTEKIVDRIITDPKQQEAIKLLIKENNDLKLKISQISSTVATNTSTNGTGTTNPFPGTITPPQVVRSLPTTNETANEGPNSGTVGGNNSTFKDYQLTATYSSKSFNYTLLQTFIIESSTGRDSSGKVSIGIVRLFQDTPGGLKPIPAKTTVIQANETKSKWFVSPRGQIGFGIQSDKSRMGLAAFQWLKRGSSKAPEDIRWAILSPAMSVQNGQAVPLLLPISLNLGSFHYTPVTNVWLSPTITKDKKLGISLTMTF